MDNRRLELLFNKILDRVDTLKWKFEGISSLGGELRYKTIINGLEINIVASSEPEESYASVYDTENGYKYTHELIHGRDVESVAKIAEHISRLHFLSENRNVELKIDEFLYS